MSLTSLGIAELSEQLRARAVSPLEALEALETRICAVDGKIGGYISRDFEAAKKAALTADVNLPLGGIPIAIKDLISVAGEPCRAASKILEGYIAPYDATVIARLKAAGAIPFGRANMDEFAMGSSTETSAYGLAHNPWDLSRTPGGSSGGSAAVVAADEAYAALGSETGGSIRQPASFCSCVGMKPSYGRVSRYGAVALASSLDNIGPVTKTVRDCAILMNVLAGVDPLDSTTLEAPVPDYTSLLGRDIRGLRIGIPKEYFIAGGMDPQVESAVRAAMAQYQALGAELVEISLPHTEHAVAVYYIISTAEASANLAKFDGVRYGYRAAAANLLEQYGKTRAEGFGPEVKRRIILGTYVLSSGYYDAYYLRAQKVRTLIRQDFTRAFESVDAILCPTSPEAAFQLGERSDNPLKMYLADIFTIATSLAGTCAMSIPCGFAQAGSHTLPVGLQLIGKPFAEEKLLQIAHAYEQSTDWHKRRPPIV